MKKYNIIFFGTSLFATSAILALLQLNNIIITAVITQPDKKIGRNQKIIYSPIKNIALKKHLLLLQPNKVDEIYDILKKMKIDIILTCSYGQFIPQKILDLSSINSFNIHPSLLPRLRGGAPIHKAIIYGEKETGISIVKINNKMDSGAIYYQHKILISLKETTLSLHNKLMSLVSKIIKNKLIQIIQNKYIPIQQNENLATYAYNITRKEEKIDWNKPLINIYNQIRGMYSWPIAYTYLKNKIYKIYIVKMLNSKLQYKDQKIINGSIVDLTKIGIKVKVINGYLIIKKIQKEGKKPILTNKYFNNPNNDIKIGNKFQ